jgi:hypothetical protein
MATWTRLNVTLYVHCLSCYNRDRSCFLRGRNWKFQCNVMAPPWLSRLIEGLSSRRPRLDPRPVVARFVVDTLALGQVFLRVLWVFPCQYHSTIVPYWSSSTRCFYQNDRRSKPGSLPKISTLSYTGESRIDSYFHSLWSVKEFTHTAA